MTNVAPGNTAGFTLIDLLIAVAITAILASMAVATYGNYVRTSKLSTSFAILSDYRLKMEQFKQDSRSYADPLNVNVCGVALPSNDKYFDFGCVIAASGTQFTTTASNKAGVGLGNAADYSYSIDQAGVQNTPTFAGAAGPSGTWKKK